MLHLIRLGPILQEQILLALALVPLMEIPLVQIRGGMAKRERRQ